MKQKCDKRYSSYVISLEKWRRDTTFKINENNACNIIRRSRSKWHLIYIFSGSVNTLSVKESRYFKPSPSAFHRDNGRSAWTWKIKPGSYFLLPYQQAFGQEFPRDSFTVFLTIKPSKDSEVRVIEIQFVCSLKL